MIIKKNDKEQELMRKAGAILHETLDFINQNIKVGQTTAQLDKMAYDFITNKSAFPTFLGYEGFPYSICASLNHEIVHGFPNNTPLQEGDIISIDIGVNYKGFNADAARTFPVGKISSEDTRLIEVTKQSFYEGIKDIKAGSRLGHISNRIQKFVEKNKFTVVRELVGHGVGKDLHEDPMVPNYGIYEDGPVLEEGMALAIEPMVNAGRRNVLMDSNGWTIKTADKKKSAHYENTILIHKDGVEIIT